MRRGDEKRHSLFFCCRFSFFPPPELLFIRRVLSGARLHRNGGSLLFIFVFSSPLKSSAALYPLKAARFSPRRKKRPLRPLLFASNVSLSFGSTGLFSIESVMYTTFGQRRNGVVIMLRHLDMFSSCQRGSLLGDVLLTLQHCKWPGSVDIYCVCSQRHLRLYIISHLITEVQIIDKEEIKVEIK